MTTKRETFILQAAPIMEHCIPVVFDVTGSSRAEAAEALAERLAGVHGEIDGGAVLESWWFPEAQDKRADGNDCAAMHLAYDTQPVPGPIPCGDMCMNARGEVWTRTIDGLYASLTHPHQHAGTAEELEEMGPFFPIAYVL